MTTSNHASRPATDIVDVDLGNGVSVQAEVWLAPAKPAEGEGRSDAGRVFRNVLKRLWAVEMLAAGDEPELVRREIQHGDSLTCGACYWP